MTNRTQAITYGSNLHRKSWTTEGLVQKKHVSMFTPFIGSSFDSIIVQKNMTGENKGNIIVFDYDGALSGRSIPGSEQAFGKGEQKIKFSNVLTINEQTLTVQNDREFESHSIGSTYLSEHEHSRDLLADLYHRWKDQALCDTMQSLTGEDPSHIISLSTFGYDDVKRVEKVCKLGRGFSTPANGVRAPLKPYKVMTGEKLNTQVKYQLFLIDAEMSHQLQADEKYQTIYSNADLRGADNQAISGVVAKLGLMYIVEAPSFFGSMVEGVTTSPFKFSDTFVEEAGFRTKDTVTGVWTGMEGWKTSNKQMSRGVVLGAGAIQMGMGKDADYRVQSDDFGRMSESALIFWPGFQKTKLKLEQGKQREMAKIAELDYGIITVDYTPA